MALEKMSVDDFLGSQAKGAHRVTIEPVRDKPDMIKVTPWTAEGRCLCHLAMNISKSSLEGVTPTGDTHACCGQILRVVELHFKKGETMPLEELFQQLSASANTAVSSAREGNPEPMYAPGQGPQGAPPPPFPWHFPEVTPPWHARMRFGGGPAPALCESMYSRCMANCPHSSNPTQCECLCRSSLSVCHHGFPLFC